MRSLVVLLVFLALTPSSAEPKVDPGEVAEALRASRLDHDRAVRVANVRLDMGYAVLTVEDGLLVPATEIGGRSAEIVFLGAARLELDPPDEIEASQLRLFTGAPRLSEPIDEAVLVVASDRAADVLLDRSDRGEIEPGKLTEASQLYVRWKSSAERKLLGVEQAILMDALGDPFYASYFAGRFRGRDLGEFLLVVEPDADEQVTLGQFEPLDVTDREADRTRRAIHREQRKGRLVGVTLDDLGTWDTWVSARMRNADGDEYPGLPGFESRHYVLDVAIDRNGQDVEAIARIEMEPMTGLRSAVSMGLFSDLEVQSIRGEDGQDLFFHQNGDRVLVVLGEVPPVGERLTLEVRYRGVAIERVEGGAFRMRDTVHWYPHVGQVDRATYDVTLRWPRKYEIVAAGRRIGQGRTADGGKWERRVIEVPSIAYGFEIGNFERKKIAMGHVSVELAFDRSVDWVDPAIEEQIVDTIRSALEYYEEVFGPYPLDELTVVTVLRGYSQGLPGFLTLSSLVAQDLGPLEALLGIADRRLIVAHELAHQWWGNLVGWRGYRDQWLSEALANYSAMAWERNRISDSRRSRVGLTEGWQSLLTQTTEDGHPVESLGPLVLGSRLNSSYHEAAYQLIAYKKGTVVLDMLAIAFGEERFLGALRELARVGAHRLLTNDSFIAFLEQVSGADLEPFADQYVYGTGLPEVHYSYEFESDDDGTWTVSGEARQQPSFRYTYRVEEVREGTLDVRRDLLPQMNVDRSTVVAPFLLHAREGSSTQRLTGHMIFSERVNEFGFDVEREPVNFWFDRDHRVFASFFCEERAAKRVRFHEALDALAAGKPEESENLFLAALDETEAVGETLWEQLFLAGRVEVEIRYNLAWMYLDQGRLVEAATQIREGEKAADNTLLSDHLDVLQARLEILRGDVDRAHKRLRKKVFRKHRMDETPAYVLLAITSAATGDAETYARASDVGRERGADLSALPAVID
jgi:hypothetical protein